MPRSVTLHVNATAILIHHIARLLDHVRARHCDSRTPPQTVTALYDAEHELYKAMDALGYDARKHRL